MRYQTLPVLIADVPGLTISVPYEEDEPIRLTLDRVTHKLANTAYGDPHSLRSLYLDGVRIEDYSKSMRHYGLFGNTITYKGMNNAQQREQPIKFLSEKQETTIEPKPKKLFSFARRRNQRRSAAKEDITKAPQIRIISEKGESMKLALDKDKTVWQLKTQISSKIQGGLPAVYQHLFFDGKRLDDNNTLNHYKMQNNATIHLLTANRSFVTPTAVFVKTLNGKTIVCRASMTQSVEDLKKLIQLKENIPITQQSLVYEGKYLEKESQRLENYGIRNNDTLHLTIRLRGGSMVPTLFADVSDNGGRLKKLWSSDAPKGRTACRGANIEVKCKCTKYQVISQQGFGLYELNETPTACPNCNSFHVTPVTVGFSCCQYRIHGVKSNGQHYKSEWMVVRKDDQYQAYDDAKQVAWRRLGIESRPLGDSTDDPCTICLEDISNITTLPCGHPFHTDCIAGWDMTCPNCRCPQLQKHSAAVLI